MFNSFCWSRVEGNFQSGNQKEREHLGIQSSKRFLKNRRERSESPQDDMQARIKELGQAKTGKSHQGDVILTEMVQGKKCP